MKNLLKYVAVLAILGLMIFQHVQQIKLQEICKSIQFKIKQSEHLTLSNALNCHLKLNKEDFTCLNSDDILIADLEKDKYMFIYYDEYACNSCLEKIITLLNEKKINHVAFIFSFERQNVCRSFIENYNLPGIVFYTKRKIELTKYPLTVPYFFTLENNMRIKYLFAFSKNNRQFNNSFLEKIVSETNNLKKQKD